ncbi:MAG: glycosyltransferase family 2 protein [Pseudomonadales bacterium]
MAYNDAMNDTQQTPIHLSISVVLFRNNRDELLRFRQCLTDSVRQLRNQHTVARIALVVVDNAASEDGDQFSSLFTRIDGIDAVRFICAESNLGYGQAHNRCIHQGSDFHLFMNPDVYLDAQALAKGLDYLQQHDEVGMVTPFAVNDQKTPLFLSKRYPTVLDFTLRGFAPTQLKKLFQQRLARYEMHKEYLSEHPYQSVEIASGCCMLIRTNLLQKLNGFSSAYFLYFEDFDLSVRLREHAKIAFVPAMKIIHDGGHASRKGWWHIKQFARAGYIFFTQHGWRWF